MSIIQALITEIEIEAANTKKMLQSVPFNHAEWKPHNKSMAMKPLAVHTAQLAGWAGLIVSTDELDFANNNLPNPEINSTEDLINYFEEGTKQSIEALKSAKEGDLQSNWTLRAGDKILMKMPKYSFIRIMAMNHVYHHRAQLGVYLRLLNIPVPGMYGPSADDKS